MLIKLSTLLLFIHIKIFIVKNNLKMKKLILFITAVLLFIGCGVSNKSVVNQSMYGYVKNIDCRQLDSICVVDDLSNNIEEWFKMEFVDYETRNVVTEFLYIKDVSETYDAMYILVKNGECKYKITKRIRVTKIDE